MSSRDLVLLTYFAGLAVVFPESNSHLSPPGGSAEDEAHAGEVCSAGLGV